jgi:hypothetical protein
MIIKGKQEENGLENSSSNSFFVKLFTNARVRNIVIFWVVRYFPIPELEIFVGIVH